LRIEISKMDIVEKLFVAIIEFHSLVMNTDRFSLYIGKYVIIRGEHANHHTTDAVPVI
jgi:hypothetical protein